MSHVPSRPLADPSGQTLIDALLAEQQKLTLVERFSLRHSSNDLPAQARYYQDLIPGAAPGPGQQYAFAVDLDVCTGCKACVSACHSLNGLEEDEIWRTVGLIHGGTADQPFQQTITTACHHCVEPGCLEGCPVLAYEKDAETGIVRHLDDQCIGCQYCVLKCPYDVPKYSERLGIVRKCDMCIGRLKAGEAPACVQACPHEAITISIVDQEVVRAESQPQAAMIPGAFDSSYTKPATRFTSERGTPANARPADEGRARLEHAHWPLIFMLVLTQAAVGLELAAAIAAWLGNSLGELRALTLTGFLVLQIGLGVSILHLGRPLGAWRFFLGLRTSWMSREILAFGVFAGTAAVSTAALWFPPLHKLTAAMLTANAVMGLLAVFTSAMIYADTRRPFWALRLTAQKFFGTAVVLGLAGVVTLQELLDRNATIVALGAIIATIIRQLSPAWAGPSTTQHLPWAPALRRTLMIAAVACWSVVIGWGSSLAALVGLIAATGLQVLERYCFFTTCPTPRMPGGIAA